MAFEPLLGHFGVDAPESLSVSGNNLGFGGLLGWKADHNSTLESKGYGLSSVFFLFLSLRVCRCPPLRGSSFPTCQLSPVWSFCGSYIAHFPLVRSQRRLILSDSFMSKAPRPPGTPPAWHRGLPGPSGPEPQKSPKRVRKGVPGPPAPGSRRIPKECAPESEKSPKTQLRTLFGLFSDSGAHSLGILRLPGTLFGLFWGFRASRAREPSVPGGGVPNSRPLFVPRKFGMKSLL